LGMREGPHGLMNGEAVNSLRAPVSDGLSVSKLNCELISQPENRLTLNKRGSTHF